MHLIHGQVITNQERHANIVLVFGLFMTGLLRLSWLTRDLRYQGRIVHGTPYAAFGLGFAFALGWTPCIGPVLGAILTVSAVSPQVGSGIALLGIYSFGLGVPFIAAALFTGAFVARMGPLRRMGRPLSIGAGVMIVMGIAMITGYMTTLVVLDAAHVSRVRPDRMNTLPSSDRSRLPSAPAPAVFVHHRSPPIKGDDTMQCFRTSASSAHPAMLAILLAVALLPASVLAAEQPVPIADLAKRTHFHGIAAHPDPSGGIHLATHHGLFRVDERGLATRVSASSDDFMGFTPHPTRPEVLYASGHPARGGNLGFIASTDSGRTWRQLSPGLNGPVDFHQLAVSKADPGVIYGAFRGLQVSRDGGETWHAAAPAPDGLIGLAASSLDPDRLYAATKGGLLYSTDAGKIWQPAHIRRSAATMVYAGYDNDVYAFMIGVGLVRTREPTLRWELVSDQFGEDYLLHLAVDPDAAQHVYAVTSAAEVIESRDGGARWTPLGAMVAD